ncbi:MAG: cupin domain-containing protein [Pseudomonadota bacterium]
MMFQPHAFATLAFVALLSPLGAQADQIEATELATMELQPLPTFPGVATGFLIGGFDVDGLYAAQATMAQGSVFPPHTHPDDRLTIVLDGVMYLGEGDTAELEDAVAYPAGTAAITPAGIAHFMLAPKGDVRVLEIGAGPSGTAFLTAD